MYGLRLNKKQAEIRMKKTLAAIEDLFTDECDIEKVMLWPEYEFPKMSMARFLACHNLGSPLPADYSFGAVTGDPLDNQMNQILVIRPDGKSALVSDLMEVAPYVRKASRFAPQESGGEEAD